MAKLIKKNLVQRCFFLFKTFQTTVGNDFKIEDPDHLLSFNSFFNVDIFEGDLQYFILTAKKIPDVDLYTEAAPFFLIAFCSAKGPPRVPGRQSNLGPTERQGRRHHMSLYL